MAKGNGIIVTGCPKGTFHEGTINDTSRPGTIMQIRATTTFPGNQPTVEAAAPGTDGKNVIPMVLLEDREQGKTVNDAFVAGTRCRLYVPATGEDMNIRVGEVAGTGNTITVGDRLIIDAEDGLLVPESGSPQDTIFIAMETLTQVAGGTLCWVRYMG